MNKKAIASIRCGSVRECANYGCMLKMLFLGYKINPQGEVDKNRNMSLERGSGKGFYPRIHSVGRGEFIDVVCEDFKEKK